MTHLSDRSLTTGLIALAFGAALAVTSAMAAGGGGGSGSGGGGAGGGGGGSSAGGSGSGAGAGAAGGGSNGGSMIRKQTDLTTCPKGKVWSVKKKACIANQSGLFSDDELTDYAFSLAKAKRFDEALATLDELQGPPSPKALNYRGYATRKLGRTEEGIGFYLQSVKMDPQYAQVREYLGEAYMILGKADLAKEQLKAIETICGNTECEEYEDLSKAIAGTPDEG